MVKLVSFIISESNRFGLLNNTTITDITDITPYNTLLQVLQSSTTIQSLLSKIQEQSDLPRYNLQDVELCSPIRTPNKVLCVGMNYKEHCIEQNIPIPKEPVIFNKFTSSVTGPNSNVLFDSKLTQQMDFEVELAIVIGKGGRDIAKANAFHHVAGITVAHDVSARDWQLQKNGGQWLLGKCQDTFCPLGPCLVTLDEIPDVNNLRVTCRLNGTTVQDSNTSEWVFDIPAIIEWITQFITLAPGDIILTGTPSGVGCFRKPQLWLKHGDIVECEIEHLGTIRNLMVDKSVVSSSNIHFDSIGETKSNQNQKDCIEMYVGTYTENKGFVDGKGKGIYPCLLNSKTGEMYLNGSPLLTSNPTYVTKSKDGKMLYSISEDSTVTRGQLSGSTRSWNISTTSTSNGTTGNMTSSYASGGTDSCYIELNLEETYAFVSNYSTGSIVMFPVRPDRSLGPACSFVQHDSLPNQTLPGLIEDRQDGPHAHQSRFYQNSTGQNYLYVPDLGLDCVIMYSVNLNTGTLKEMERYNVESGGGPRHMDWYTEREEFVYVGLEMGCGITVFQRDIQTGALSTIIQRISSLPVDCTMKNPENTTAQLLIHPSGKWIYVSNRGHDTIGCYSINVRTGELTAVGWYSSNGGCPRNFQFSQDGKLCIVANQNTHDIYSYTVDMETGALVDTGFNLTVPSPVCICL